MVVCSTRVQKDVGSKSAALTLPGIGEVDLKNLTGLLSGLPNIPTLPPLFNKSPCVSTVSARVGTCLKEAECQESHGLSDGKCALSLGVCCTQAFQCGSFILGNVSLITSPGYPTPSKKSDVCEFIVNKSPAVGQIRLDFEDFDIAGVDDEGKCSQDVFEIEGANPGFKIPRICGMNRGQHLYIPVDQTAILSQVKLRFVFSTAPAERLFKLRITQLGLDHPVRAPAGCLQYFTGLNGSVSSFNFEHVKNVGIKTIKGLNYGVCFRQEAGFCSVRVDPVFTRSRRSVPYQYPIRPNQIQYIPRPAYHQYQQPYYFKPTAARMVYAAGPVYHAANQVPVYGHGYSAPAPAPKKEILEAKTEIVKDFIDAKINILKQVLPAFAPIIDLKKDLIVELLNGKKILLEELAAGQTGPLAEVLGLKAELLNELLKGKEVLLRKSPEVGMNGNEPKIDLVKGIVDAKINLLKQVFAPLAPIIDLKKDLLTELLTAKKDFMEDLGRGQVSPLADLLGLKAELLGELLKGKQAILMKKPSYAAPGNYPSPSHAYGYNYGYVKPESKVEIVEDVIDFKLNLLKQVLGTPFLGLIEAKKDLVRELLQSKQDLLEDLARGQVSPLADILGFKADILAGIIVAKKDILQKVPVYGNKPSYGINYNYKPEIKETKVELAKDLIEEKTRLINELFSGKKESLPSLFPGLTVPVIPLLPPVLPTLVPLPITGLTDSDLKKLLPVQPLEEKVEETKITSSAIVSPDFVDSGDACKGRDSIGVPPHAILCAENAHPAIISTTPFAVFVDTRGNIPSRGFHFVYTQQIC